MAGKAVVQIEVPAIHAEVTADLLWQGGPSAVAVEERGDGTVRIIADPDDLEVLAALPEGAQVELLDPDRAGHHDEWRAWANPVRAGERVVLHPAWLPEAADLDDVVIRIDPGRVFGSGSHPSTRLCVGVIEELAAPGLRVLDVGTGSGVLAITACVLGAASAVAIDVDANVLHVVPQNAAANGVADRVSVSTADLGDVDGAFDLVLANIGLGVLHELRAELSARVVVGGHLVLAGLLNGQVDPLLAGFGACHEVVRRHLDGWTAVVLRREV